MSIGKAPIFVMKIIDFGGVWFISCVGSAVDENRLVPEMA